MGVWAFGAGYFGQYPTTEVVVATPLISIVDLFGASESTLEQFGASEGTVSVFGAEETVVSVFGRVES